MSTQQSGDNPNGADAQAESRPSEAGTGRLAVGPLTGTVFALVGGCITWAVIQTCYPVFSVPEEMYADIKGPPSPEKTAEIEVAARSAAVCNAVCTMGLFGAIIGGVLALGEGIARRSVARTLVAAIVAAFAGALFGCLAGYLGDLALLMQKSGGARPGLADSLQTHSIILATLGGGIGIGLGVLTGRIRTMGLCLIAGLLAGALAAVLYIVSAAMFLPTAGTEKMVPEETMARLLWVGLTSVLLGLTIPAIAGKPRTT